MKETQNNEMMDMGCRAPARMTQGREPAPTQQPKQNAAK